MDKENKKIKEADVHDELKGFDINIDPFGNISSNINLDKINSFLDTHVPDKKLLLGEEE